MFAAAFVLLAAVAADGDPAYKIRRDIVVGTTVTSPREIVKLAKEDVEKLPSSLQHYARYVWVPDWVEPDSGFAQVALVANSTFSRTTNMPQPVSLYAGRLIRMDLQKYAASSEHITEIVNLYELLREQDSFFNTEVVLKGDVAVVVTDSPKAGDELELKTSSGQWVKSKLVSRTDSGASVEYKGSTYSATVDQLRWKGAIFPASAAVPSVPVAPHKTRFASAAYLYPEGAELFRLTNSDVPIMRLDEWVAFTFSTVNGGKYYQLVGIEKNLEDTIKKFAGKDASDKIVRFSETLRRAEDLHKKTSEPLLNIANRLDPELAKTKAYIEESRVTGRQRLVVFIYGAATAPASGPHLVAVTFDIGEDNFSPDSDPLRSPTTFERYDGGEAILALPNGLLGYLVFNKNDVVIASVPDNVAHDFSAREVRSNVATVRVFSGLSCAHCHDNTVGNWGWQPVANDYNPASDSLAKVLDDRGQPDLIRAQQVTAAQYGAKDPDITKVLDLARQSYQFRAQLATNQKTTRETVAGLADSYWGYYYDYVTPQVAARDLGQFLAPDAAQLFLLRAIEPEKDKEDPTILRDDVVLARLKDGRKVSPVQWRSQFQSYAERANFHLELAP